MVTPQKKKPSRSGTTRTEAQLAAAGWAPRPGVRLRIDEAEAIQRLFPDLTVAWILRWAALEMAKKAGFWRGGKEK